MTKAILLHIERLLLRYFKEHHQHLLKMKLAAEREYWLDSATVKQMLRISDRTYTNMCAKASWFARNAAL